MGAKEIQESSMALWLGMGILTPDFLGPNPDSATYQLCDPEQVTYSLQTSVVNYKRDLIIVPTY